ncbi:MAG: polyprenyl synthetase family protein [Chloroflexota bacterium]
MTDEAPLISGMRQAVQADLRGLVDHLITDPQLYEMVEHHFGWANGAPAGKGVRPLLCLLCCAGAGGQWERALPAATAIELIHNFSLIHDDIQDGSELRRHRPTVWKVWGEALAINAGDALFACARLSTQRLDLDPPGVLTVHRNLDEACLELTIGQQLDLAFDTRSDGSIQRYLRMIEAKTAALLAASAGAGALVAGARGQRLQAFQSFGRQLGMAFQIQDDILGVWGVPNQTGKAVGQDLLVRKPSFPALHALGNSRRFLSLWNDSDSDLGALLGALEAAGSREAATQAVGEHTARSLSSFAQAEPAEPAATALRGLADGLLERQS